MKLFRILFLIFSFFIFAFAVINFKAPDTDIIKAFVPSSGSNNYLSKLAGLSNKRANIVFEAENYDELENLKNEFLGKIPPAEHGEYNDVLEIYKKYPNFLSYNTKKLIKTKNYRKLDEESLERVYNPFGFYVLPPDKDPYLLLTDFVLNNLNELQEEETLEYQGKCYSLSGFEIKEKDDIKKLVKAQSEVNKLNSGHVYLTGSPVHSYFCAKRSNVEINIICVFATLCLILICYRFFKTVKILIPIAISIIFGILSGLSAVILIFKNVHILSVVFSTSLIGISLDYSLHYFVSAKEKGFKKSLAMSLISTVLAFLVLYFSNIEILKQISIFMSFGLFGVYLFAVLILPLFKMPDFKADFKLFNLEKFKKPVLAIVLAVIILGTQNLKFTDNIKNLYSPKGELLKAESLYHNLFSPQKTEFILIKGNSVDEILQKEEEISNSFKGAKFLALSRFVSSLKLQKENQKLLKTLYKDNLGDYAAFLDKEAKDKLLTESADGLYNPEDFPLKDKFMLDETTSFMVLYGNVPEVNGLKTINVQNELGRILKNFRHKCFKIIPLVFIIAYAVVASFSGKQRAFKIVLPSFFGSLFAICLISLFGGQINVFHLLALILTIGFSLDYSIFRSEGGSSSSSAVFISCISSFISFTLISFAGFKVISSLGITLSLGILTSYILSLVLISENETEKA